VCDREMASNKPGTSGLGVKRSYKDDISSRIFNTEWIENFFEIIELQSSTVLKCKYKESSKIIEFWKCLPEEDFPELHNLAVKLVCRFGSTYTREKSFSRMTFIKNKYRTKLTNSHLKNLILLSSTKLKPNYEEIISMKQIQHT